MYKIDNKMSCISWKYLYHKFNTMVSNIGWLWYTSTITYWVLRYPIWY